jgi:hypothetical protein
MTTYKKHDMGNEMYTEYSVKTGETTLKQIAKKYLYGNESRSNEIKVFINEKPEPVPDPDHLKTGMVLSLPTTKYTVKTGETTVKQIARDHLHDESRFKEIFCLKSNILAYPDETNLQPGLVLLLPPVFVSPPVPEELATFTNVSLDGNFVRSGAGIQYPELYHAKIGTKFTYKKSSLTKDSGENLWVRATSAGQTEGYICVRFKENNGHLTHYTNPPID